MKKDMKPIIDRVCQRMDVLGLKQDRLAQICDVNQSDISKLLNNKLKKSPSWMYNLAIGLRTNVNWLETGIDEMPVTQMLQSVNYQSMQYPQNNSYAKTSANHLIPVYGPAPAAINDVIRFTEEYMIDQTLPVPLIANTKGAFAMQVRGDSMSPRKEPGELIYIHPYQEPTIGKDCVVVYKEDGNAVYKRYLGRTLDNTEVILKQFNPLREFTVPLEDILKIYAVVF